jgi:hypothetical protein
MQKRVSQRFRHQMRVTSVKNHPTLLTTHNKESYWLFHSEEKLITDTIGFSFDVFGINPKKLFVLFSMHHLSFVTHKISHHLNIQTSPIFNKTLKSEESRRLNRQINFIISSSHSSTPNTTNNLATGPGTRPSKDTHDYEHSTVIKSKQSQTRLPISLFPNYDIPMQL